GDHRADARLLRAMLRVGRADLEYRILPAVRRLGAGRRGDRESACADVFRMTGRRRWTHGRFTRAARRYDKRRRHQRPRGGHPGFRLRWRGGLVRLNGGFVAVKDMRAVDATDEGLAELELLQSRGKCGAAMWAAGGQFHRSKPLTLHLQ